jgi:hypothetical protein
LPWCISTPPRPVRAAREDGGGRGNRGGHRLLFDSIEANECGHRKTNIRPQGRTGVHHRTRCERAAVWLCDRLGVSHLTAASFRRSPGLGLGGFGSCYSVVHRDGIESSRSISRARSARYLLSACALVVSHATAFLSQITFASLLSRGLSTTKRGTCSSLAVLIGPHLQNLPPAPLPPPRFLQNRQPTSSSTHIANTDTEHVRF